MIPASHVDCCRSEMFSGAVNPVTGRLEWVKQDRDVLSEDSDISPELRRSQYGDMLHDRQRVRNFT